MRIGVCVCLCIIVLCYVIASIVVVPVLQKYKLKFCGGNAAQITSHGAHLSKALFCFVEKASQSSTNKLCEMLLGCTMFKIIVTSSSVVRSHC